MVKRTFDFFLALFLLIILSPLFFLLILVILIFDHQNPFFTQERIGINGKPFTLVKFRTMRNDPNGGLHITVGTRDPRITKAGYYLRRYKLDELPQLFNILLGHMSFVGPRPEVRKYVDLYTPEQRKILRVKPGLTSYASLLYFDENRILGKSKHAEEVYIHDILPKKIEIDLRYAEDPGISTDLVIIFRTIFRIIKLPLKNLFPRKN